MDRKTTKRRVLNLEHLESRDLFSAVGWPSNSPALGLDSAEPSACVSSVKATPNLTMGSIVSGAITRAKQRSQFTFHVTRETVVQFAVTGTAPNGFSACADLYDSRGHYLLTINASQLRNYRFNTAGTYRIQLHDQHLTKTGRFTFGLEQLSASYSSDRRAIGFGSLVSGAIGKPIQQNQYTFKVEKEAVVQFVLTGTAPNGFLACADLYDSRGNYLLTVTADQCRNYKFNTAGTYMIQLHDLHLTKAGTYTLGLEQLSAPFSPDKQAIGFGSIVSGTIGTPIQQNQHIFAVEKEAVLQFAITGADSNGFLAQADIYDPKGNYLLTVTAGQLRNYTFNTAGTYMIQLHDQGLAKAGSYTLGLEQLSASFSPDKQSIGFGSVVGGTIDKPIQRNQYTFEAGKGAVVQFAITGTDSNGFLIWADIYDQRGNYLLTVTADQVRNYTFNNAGTYMIQLHDQDFTKSGSYTLGLEQLSAPFSPDKQSVALGSSVSGTIAEPIQRNQYFFQVSQGTTVLFTLTGIDTNGFRSFADIYDSQGHYLLSVEVGRLGRYTFNTAGTYMVQVRDQTLDKVGSYTLVVENA